MKIKKGLVFPRSQDEKHGSEDPDDHSPQTGTPSDADHHDKGRFHLQNLIFQPLIYTTNRQNGLRWRIVMETCTGLGSQQDYEKTKIIDNSRAMLPRSVK